MPEFDSWACCVKSVKNLLSPSLPDWFPVSVFKRGGKTVHCSSVLEFIPYSFDSVSIPGEFGVGLVKRLFGEVSDAASGICAPIQLYSEDSVGIVGMDVLSWLCEVEQ